MDWQPIETFDRREGAVILGGRDGDEWKTATAEWIYGDKTEDEVWPKGKPSYVKTKIAPTCGETWWVCGVLAEDPVLSFYPTYWMPQPSAPR